MYRTSFIIVFFTLLLLLSACFPSKRATVLEKEAIDSVFKITAPTKVYLADASVVLYPRGFQVTNDTIWGNADRYGLDNSKNRVASVPLDSVQAMTYYDRSHNVMEVLGSLVVGVYGTAITFLSVYCLTCPKCCFGSCPTLYTDDGDAYKLQAELFSYCISRYYQETDLDKLSYKESASGKFRIKVCNEAMETHYINQLALWAVQHPPGTLVYPASDESLILFQDPQIPAAARNKNGEDMLPLVTYKDNNSYRSDTTLVKKLTLADPFDRLDLRLPLTAPAEQVKLLLRLKNTLLSTVLFYEVVLKSQGMKAVEWTEKMNNDPGYAAMFNSLYKAYAGIHIKVLRENRWRQVSIIADSGPIAWKELALAIPLEKSDLGSGELNVRLEFFTDHFMIDYIAYESGFSAEDLISVKELQPHSITDDAGNERMDVPGLLKDFDEQMLISWPGDSYVMEYDVPQHAAQSVSLFVRSKGYYTEWLRGDWISTAPSSFRFNIFEPEKTIESLREHWLENRPLLEETFFNTRIPLKEEL